MENQQHQHQKTTSPFRGTSSSRSLSMRTYPAPPPLHPNLFHSSYNPHSHPHPHPHPQDYFNFHPLSAPPLQHYHHQMNPPLPILLPPYQPLPLPLYQPQPPPQFFTPEHHYLLLSLNRETTKTHSLNQKIAAVESSLSSLALAHSSTPPSPSPCTPPPPNPNRRKLKKQLSWLKCRARESTRQEMSLRKRLGEMVQEERRSVGVGMWVFGGGQRRGDEGGGAGVDARLREEDGEGEGTRKFSNDFWNVEAPVFEPVDFLAPCSRGGKGVARVEEEGWEARGGGRLSRGWDECELSPLEEERVERVGEWEGSGDGDGDGDKETEIETETSGKTSANSPRWTETQIAIATPVSQQSSRVILVGGAKSCGDVRLCFLDTKWEGGGDDGGGTGMEGCRAEVGLKGLGLVGRKGGSLPVGGELVGFRERKEVDQVW